MAVSHVEALCPIKNVPVIFANRTCPHSVKFIRNIGNGNAAVSGAYSATACSGKSDCRHGGDGNEKSENDFLHGGTPFRRSAFSCLEYKGDVGRGTRGTNNQDHSMVTAFEAVNNILSGKSGKDNVWNVNTEEEYHEEKSS